MNTELKYRLNNIKLSYGKRSLEYCFSLGSPYIVYQYSNEFRKEKNITYSRWKQATRKYGNHFIVKEEYNGREN